MHCRLSCIALQTGQIHHSMDNVIDGTLCSYESPHAICIQVFFLIKNFHHLIQNV